MVTWLGHSSFRAKSPSTAVEVRGSRSLEGRVRWQRRRPVRDGRWTEKEPRDRAGGLTSSSNDRILLTRDRGVDSSTVDFGLLVGTGSDVIVEPDFSSVNESSDATLVSNIVNYKQQDDQLLLKSSRSSLIHEHLLEIYCIGSHSDFAINIFQCCIVDLMETTLLILQKVRKEINDERCKSYCHRSPNHWVTCTAPVITGNYRPSKYDWFDWLWTDKRKRGRLLGQRHSLKTTVDQLFGLATTNALYSNSKNRTYFIVNHDLVGKIPQQFLPTVNDMHRFVRSNRCHVNDQLS